MDSLKKIDLDLIGDLVVFDRGDWLRLRDQSLEILKGAVLQIHAAERMLDLAVESLKEFPDPDDKKGK